MQRVFCVRFSADSTYVLSGSDETNIRYDEKKKNDATAIQTSFSLQFRHFCLASLVFFSSNSSLGLSRMKLTLSTFAAVISMKAGLTN